MRAQRPSFSAQVHAVVLNCLPDIDAASPAYTAMDKHGPIFALLNQQLMGHTGRECRRVFGPVLGRLDEPSLGEGAVGSTQQDGTQQQL